ncbi:MAG: hypothetical protein ACE5E7_15345 [Anaerolineae bacterium]
MPNSGKPLRIAIVGPCAAGKTTLANALKAVGYEVRQPAQEHSYVPDMWRRMSNPDVLIYLDIDYANSKARRPYRDEPPQWLEEQRKRLALARQHCDLYLDTSNLTPDQVKAKVFSFLE